MTHTTSHGFSHPLPGPILSSLASTHAVAASPLCCRSLRVQRRCVVLPSRIALSLRSCRTLVALVSHSRCTCARVALSLRSCRTLVALALPSLFVVFVFVCFISVSCEPRLSLFDSCRVNAICSNNISISRAISISAHFYYPEHYKLVMI